MCEPSLISIYPTYLLGRNKGVTLSMYLKHLQLMVLETNEAQTATLDELLHFP